MATQVADEKRAYTTVRLKPSLWAATKREAAERTLKTGRTVHASDLVEEALRKLLARRRS